MLYRRILLIAISLLLFGCANFSSQGEVLANQEYLPLPTPANNLPDLIKGLSSTSDAVRIVSAGALQYYGKDAIVAVPALIDNLHARNYEVQISAAVALGLLGPSAKDAVQDLIPLLEPTNTHQLRTSVADALGKIRDPLAVPYLAKFLYEDNSFLTGRISNAIGNIVHVDFAELNEPGFTLNDQGVPLIVVDARAWWENVGRYQDWAKESELEITPEW